MVGLDQSFCDFITNYHYIKIMDVKDGDTHFTFNFNFNFFLKKRDLGSVESEEFGISV